MIFYWSSEFNIVFSSKHSPKGVWAAKKCIWKDFQTERREEISSPWGCTEVLPLWKVLSGLGRCSCQYLHFTCSDFSSLGAKCTVNWMCKTQFLLDSHYTKTRCFSTLLFPKRNGTLATAPFNSAPLLVNISSSFCSTVEEKYLLVTSAKPLYNWHSHDW